MYYSQALEQLVKICKSSGERLAFQQFEHFVSGPFFSSVIEKDPLRIINRSRALDLYASVMIETEKLGIVSRHAHEISVGWLEEVGAVLMRCRAVVLGPASLLRWVVEQEQGGVMLEQLAAGQVQFSTARDALLAHCRRRRDDDAGHAGVDDALTLHDIVLHVAAKTKFGTMMVRILVAQASRVRREQRAAKIAAKRGATQRLLTSMYVASGVADADAGDFARALVALSSLGVVAQTAAA